MATILIGSGGGGRGSVGTIENLYVKGDDDGQWYSCGLSFDLTLGIYLWSVGSAGPTAPSNSKNLSDRVIGSAYFCKDADHYWHRFNMTATDNDMPGFVWTDADQTTSNPHVDSLRPVWRADDGLYIIDNDGSQIHKMGVTGGLWSELNQGYAIPL